MTNDSGGAWEGSPEKLVFVDENCSSCVSDSCVHVRDFVRTLVLFEANPDQTVL